jgi:hypothetical protein
MYRKFSVVMSFVALIAATSVAGVAIFSNKGHNSVTPTQVSVIKKEPEIPKVIDTKIKPVGTTGTSFVIPNPNDLPVPISPQPYKPIDIPKNVPKPDPQPSVQPGTTPQPNVPERDALYDPNSAYVFAVGDLLTIPQHDQCYIRYLSLYNIPKAKRKEVAAVISWMVNSLSTCKEIYIPEFVGASNETLIRLDIRSYEWNPEAWEKLGAKGSGVRPFPEPYFHIILEKPIVEKQKVKKAVNKMKKVQTGTDQYGRPVYTDKEFKEEIEVEEVVSTKREIYADPLAPWLDPLAINTLVKGTHSEFPVFRADWFLANASLPPAYYDFLKLGNNVKDFENLVGADEEKAAKFRSQDKAVIVTSMVARNNRTLLRSPAFTKGYKWTSHDSLKSIDDRNYVQNLLDEKFDATEDIGTLPNRLQAYFLTDGKGNRIDAANTDIAIDNTAVDRVVRNGRSCMICHADGIRPVNDKIRSLTRKLQNREQVKLLVTREKDAKRVQDLFSEDLDDQIVQDQNIYRKAVARATGMQSEAVAIAFSGIYNWYAEDLVTSETLSRDIGINFNDLQPYIRASKDDLILGLIKNPIEPIRRDQWEASFQRFMILIMARKQGLDHADPFPPGPLINLPVTKP